MVPRRMLMAIALLAVALCCFFIGNFHAQGKAWPSRVSAPQLEAIRAEVRSELRRSASNPAGVTGTAGARIASDSIAENRERAARDTMIAEIKQELQNEMGLLPVQLLRDRRASFAELYTTDNRGTTSYGTAGYLGNGYFITVKHAVVALQASQDEDRRQGARRMVGIRVHIDGSDIPARLIDAGDADVEVHSGDWAIIRTRSLDLPPLQVDTTFPYEFAAPIFRLGNDYSKGIILSTGYIGQRTSNGLVTSLTDGHPGVSGGGVLDQRGNLVGIPVGRMQGDYRFSFILPVRREMFRNVHLEARVPDGQIASATR